MLKDFFRSAFFLVELFKRIYILYNLLNYLMSLNIFSSSVVDFLFFYSNVSQPKICESFLEINFDRITRRRRDLKVHNLPERMC